MNADVTFFFGNADITFIDALSWGLTNILLPHTLPNPIIFEPTTLCGGRWKGLHHFELLIIQSSFIVPKSMNFATA
ncbi:hypothetical protein BVRB_5g127100 [Beta vulgaris subsp. vulgaris]|uniref:Uncharacterized protein n=1 Tax=Beta vulgaris subsp. vulgaris TaxID=3555 RepID=A0A0J8E2V3_BETVV|nr:hypothetical protein BVRB_5g127100 [Beta vulgaris subsp. vulgaris]